MLARAAEQAVGNFAKKPRQKVRMHLASYLSRAWTFALLAIVSPGSREPRRRESAYAASSYTAWADFAEMPAPSSGLIFGRKNMRTALKFSVALVAVLAGCTNKTNEPTASRSPGTSSSAPSGKEESKRDRALVRFVQAIPDSNRMDLFFGDNKVFSNVSYKEVTPYIEVPAERHEFKLQTSGETQAQPRATNNEGLTAGGRYTLVALKKDNGELNLLPVNDDLAAPSAGKAKVRFINAATGLGKVDVASPSEKMFSGVEPESSTSYKEVAPLRGPLEVRNDKKVATLRIRNVDLEPDKMYTIVLLGGSGKPLEAVPVMDELTPATGD